MKLHISVARYFPESPLWEVYVFWSGPDGAFDEAHDHGATFGSERAARAYAERLREVVENRVARFFKTQWA